MTELFATIVYVLCFLTSVACAWLLGRSYQRGRTRLLLWSSVCFGFLAADRCFDHILNVGDVEAVACGTFAIGWSPIQ